MCTEALTSSELEKLVYLDSQKSAVYKVERMSPLRSGLKRTETENTRLRVNTGNYKVCVGLNPIKSDVVGFPEYCSTFQWAVSWCCHSHPQVDFSSGGRKDSSGYINQRPVKIALIGFTFHIFPKRVITPSKVTVKIAYEYIFNMLMCWWVVGTNVKKLLIF